MANTNTEREATGPAEVWLRSRYGAYRGHFAWRELEEAFNAGRASLSLPAAGQEPVASGALVALREAFAPFAQEPEWTTAHSMKYPSKAAQIINAVRDLLASEPQTGAQEQSDWDIRGQLAAKLTCWHRLTGNEAAELVALAKNWCAPQPAVAAGSLEYSVKHAHEILRRLGYHRDGDHFVNVNRAGAEAMHVSTIATIVNASLIAALPPAPSTEGA